MSQFQQAFIEEGLDILHEMEKTLLELDINHLNDETINDLFRAMHSLKGSSATFGFQEIKDTSHTIETFLEQIRNKKRTLNASDVDQLLKSVDCFRYMLNCSQQKTPIDSSTYQTVINTFITLLEPPNSAASNTKAEEKTNRQPELPQKTANKQASDSQWIISFKPSEQLFQNGNDPLYLLRSLEELGELHTIADIKQLPLLDAIDAEKCYFNWEMHLNSPVDQQAILNIFEWVTDESLLEIKTNAITTQPKHPTPVSNAAVPNELAASVTHISTESPSIRVSTNKIDSLINTIGELTISRSALKQICQAENLKNIQALQDIAADFDLKCQQLQTHALRIRMLPIHFIFNRFPRLVRDCALQLNKKVTLHLIGEQTELDKILLEKLTDPLQHLLRNAIAHGIESTEKRIALGKDPVGNIYLSAYEQGSSIIVVVQDDGDGLDLEKITATAYANGLIKEGETLSEEQCHEIIFAPGFSTSEQVDEISGRGVGLDVVKQNIQALGGNIIVESTSKLGTAFTLRLPLTLAIIDCQLVKVDGFVYTIPLHVIIEIINVDPQAITVLDNEIKIYQFKNNYINIIDLRESLSIENHHPIPKQQFLIIVEIHQQVLGLLVDELAEQQSIVIKNIEEHYKKVPGIAGTTILGDGNVALILDVNTLADIKHLKPQLLHPDPNTLKPTANTLSLEQFHNIDTRLQILSFYMAGKEYGININDVAEIFTIEKITPLPLASKYVRGVTNMRGTIIPVIDLAKRFGLTTEDNFKIPQVTIVLQDKTLAKSRLLAITIDCITSTYQITKDQIKQAPEQAKSLLANNIAGIAIFEDKLITLLHCNNFLP